MHFKTALAMAIAATAFFSCNSRPDLVKDNIANAEIQIGSLLEASEEGDTIRINYTRGGTADSAEFAVTELTDL